MKTCRIIGAAAQALLLAAAIVHGQPRPNASRGPAADLSVVLGRPTDHAVTLSVLAATAIEAQIEYGQPPGGFASRTDVKPCPAGRAVEFEITGLQPNQLYAYRLLVRAAGAAAFTPQPEASFRTQRSAGSPFVFALQGDSHPERAGKMFDAELYAQTMRNVAAEHPDFYVTLGDDFSIERLIERHNLSPGTVADVYRQQRGFLGVVGRSSALFLVNGNHEQAAEANLDGTPKSAAALAGAARTQFFPLPAPDGFYSGDNEAVNGVGLPRDYYAWTWGDALFVVIDFYWHSSVTVDNPPGARPSDGRGKGRGRDPWQVTLGDAQYHWLEQTLAQSKARWKFVFCHHVLGTGRGGVEEAGLYEWGGKDRSGRVAFAEKRPGWAMTIHELMVRHGVTVFFQGHDHLYAHQQLDGVVYQECPNPADRTYTAFNREAYRSGDVFPNAGYLRVEVGPERVAVNYISSVVPADESPTRHNGAVVHRYVIERTPSPGGRKE